jgi:predicted permease
MGAGRARVLRQGFLESSFLALAGGAAGLLVALWANRLLLAAFEWTDRPLDLSLDGRALAFSLALSLFTGVLFGLAPAVQFLRGGRLTFGQERTVAPRFASGKGLVVVEVALSLVMVASAAVFVRSFQNLRSTPLGFSAEHVSIVRLGYTNMDGEGLLKLPVAQAEALAESLRASHGIESVALADFATFHDASVGYRVSRPDVAGLAPLDTSVLRVDPNYLAAFHIPLLAGRTFTARDDERAPNVAILGESAARRLFPDGNPVGNVVSLFLNDRTEIIGIAKDIKFRSVASPAPDLLYQPLLQGQNHAAEIKLQVRSRMSPGDLAVVVRALVRDGRLPLSVTAASALEDEIGATLINDRIRMQACGLFGILALLLITAGIYGLMAYSVAQRTREIGIRMAVGSTPVKVVWLVLKGSLRLVATGVVLGLPGAYFVMKAVHSMVFGLAPVDPVSLVAAAAILMGTGVAATVAPAWRAAHLDPVRALRVQ